MTTFYVSQLIGSDAGAGTDPASPFKTLSYAYYLLGNTAIPHTIMVNDSATYFVTQSTAPSAGVTNDTNQIIATTGHLVSNLLITTGSEPDGTGCAPIFDGDGGAGTVAQWAIKFYENNPDNGWKIEGIRFQNFEGLNEYYAAVMQTTSTKVVHVSDCEFYNISGSGIYCESLNGSIARCKFEDIEDYAIHMANPAPLSGEDTLIDNCLFYHIGLGAIKATLVGGKVQHCTIYRSGEDARVAAKNRSYAYALFASAAEYNIIKDACQGSAALRATDHSYNIISGTTRNATAGGGTTGVYDYYNGILGTGDLKATEPELVNPGSITGSTSYELEKTSPARGLAVTSTSIEDIRRRSRIWSFPHSVNGYKSVTGVGRYSMAPNDAGCYEYSWTGWQGTESRNIESINSVAR